MEVNERLIRTFGEKEILDVLSNPVRYRKLLNERFNRNSNDSKTKELALIDAVEHYVFKMITTKQHSFDKRIILGYRDFLYNVFKKYPDISLDSYIFRKEVLSDIFTPEQVNEIINYKRRTTIDCNQELKRLLSRPGQTASDQLLRFAEIQIGNKSSKVNNFVDNLYKYILENENVNRSFYAREFMLKYTSYLAVKDLSMPPVSIYISSYDFNNEKATSLGTSFGNTGIIKIDRDTALSNKPIHDNLPSFVSLLTVVSHETRHSKQANDCYSNVFTVESFEYAKKALFSQYLSTSDFNEYKQNYMHSEIESDANIYGWHNTERIVHKYLPDMREILKNVVSNSIITVFKEGTASKFNNVDKKRNSKEKYNVVFMDQIVQQHPSSLNKFPILRNIYKANGQKKSFMERFLHEQSFHRDEHTTMEKINYDYYAHDIDNGELDNVDFSALSLDMQIDYFNKLVFLAEVEIKKISDSFKIYNLYDDKSQRRLEIRRSEFKHVNAMRVNRIKCIVNYINSKSDVISRLDRYNKSKNSPQPFSIFLNRLNDGLKHINKYYIDRIEDLQLGEKEEMFKELMSLEGIEVKYDGSKK